MKPSPERIAYVEGLKATLRMPLSAFELQQKRSAEAQEMARAEARRAPAPQLPLEHLA